MSRGLVHLAQFLVLVPRGGWTNECRLVFANAFEDIEFGLFSWLHQ